MIFCCQGNMDDIERKVKPPALTIAEVSPRVTLSPHLGQAFVIA